MTKRTRTQVVADIRERLADLFPSEDTAERLAGEAGIQNVAFKDAADDNWFQIVRGAERQAKLPRLIANVLEESPDPELLLLSKELATCVPSLSPPADSCPEHPSSSAPKSIHVPAQLVWTLPGILLGVSALSIAGVIAYKVLSTPPADARPMPSGVPTDVISGEPREATEATPPFAPFLQVSSFPDRASAILEGQKFKRGGFSVRVYETTTNKYAVVLGPFTDVAAREAEGARFLTKYGGRHGYQIWPRSGIGYREPPVAYDSP
jgi:hypothetical protein